MQLRTLAQTSVDEKTILLRADFNVPLKNGEVQDKTRLVESLPTIQFLLEKGAKVVLCSHLGRPKGQVMEELRLDAVGFELSKLLGKPVLKLNDCIGPEVLTAISAVPFGTVLLLENLRFHPEEEANDAAFAAALAEGKDLYVSDAFGTVHRAHASTVGVTKYLPSYAGFLVQKEVDVLSGILEHPKKPVALVVGGAKIDTKIGILEKFLDIADVFVIGGALANTFLLAQGYSIGTSLCEVEKVEVAKRFLATAAGKTVLLPTDVVVAADITPGLPTQEVAVNAVPAGQKILDLGTQTRAAFADALASVATVLWNGPMGLYEVESFAAGTRELAEALAELPAVKVIGGGDTIDALTHFGVPIEKFTHISTGGGAMLEFLEGKMLPGVEALLAQ
ncbi:phosphoglycerate kinase [Candidatus Peregrinibacteria bacterium]|nr:MAG: phosphoglycerate kinase [Candidatus Peregrinibacteria bacterium]